MVCVWGQSPVAARGEAVAARHGAPRDAGRGCVSALAAPGADGRHKPLGLLLDPGGVHFDSARPVASWNRCWPAIRLDDSNLLTRARDGMARLAALHLSKYNMHDPDVPAPPPGYVLVIDQTRDDASVTASGASERTFREMLIIAQEENPARARRDQDPPRNRRRPAPRPLRRRRC